MPAYCQYDNRPPDRCSRLGIFGGTFNPIHHGHTQVAKEVLHRYRLTSICFIPSAVPPHKTEEAVAAAAYRYEMTCLALAHEPTFTVSDVEIRRDGPSYTVDTLKHFQSLLKGDYKLFFIVGLDAFLEIDTWKAYRKLFNLAAFIVMARPTNGETDTAWPAAAVSFVHQRISADYELAQGGDTLIHPCDKPIHLASVTPVAISSSCIREMVRQGQSIDTFVDPSVAAYIERKGLYR